MTDNKKMYKESLTLAKQALEEAAYKHIGSRMFKEREIVKTSADLEKAAVDFFYAKIAYDIELEEDK